MRMRCSRTAIARICSSVRPSGWSRPTRVASWPSAVTSRARAGPRCAGPYAARGSHTPPAARATRRRARLPGGTAGRFRDGDGPGPGRRHSGRLAGRGWLGVGGSTAGDMGAEREGRCDLGLAARARCPGRLAADGRVGPGGTEGQRLGRRDGLPARHGPGRRCGGRRRVGRPRRGGATYPRGHQTPGRAAGDPPSRDSTAGSPPGAGIRDRGPGRVADRRRPSRAARRSPEPASG